MAKDVIPDVKTAQKRALHFGQKDHTRFFGRDLKDYMRAAGFEFYEFVSVEPDVSNYALHRGETLYELTKPAAPIPSKTKTRKG